MEHEIPFPDGVVTTVTGTTFMASALPKMLDEMTVACQSSKAIELYRKFKNAEAVMDEAFGIELNAYRAHNRYNRYTDKDVATSPYGELSVVRGVVDAKRRLLPMAYEHAEVALKGSGAPPFAALTLAHASMYTHMGLNVIDVHGFSKNNECTCIVAEIDKT